MPYIDGIFYDLDKINKIAIISKITKSNKESHIKIPPIVNDCRVKRIANNAFMDARYVEEIQLPDTIESIGKYAFKNCVNLKRVRISSSRLSLGEGAFMHCSKLESMSSSTWSNASLTTAGWGVFAYCESLKFDNIDFVGSVHCDTFNGCNSLTELRFAHGTCLKTGAIKNCKNLKTLYIDGKFEVPSKETLRKLKQYKLVCNETSSILDWAYWGYFIEIEDDYLPF